MKLIFTLFLGLLMTLSVSAQMAVCEPDTTDVDSILLVRPQPYHEEDNPEGGIQDCAVVEEEFNFVFTIKVDSSYQLGGTTIDVESITVNAINGLPEGLDYACSPENCDFEKNTIGCISISGVPASSNPLGEYSLEIEGSINGPVLTFETTFPNPAIAPGEYILNLAGEREDAVCMTTSTSNPLAQQLSIQNSPNPFTGLTTIEVNSALSGNFTFEVRDLLGQRLHQENIQLLNGQNTFDYEATNLPKGLYLYSISDGVNTVSRKMMVN